MPVTLKKKPANAATMIRWMTDYYSFCTECLGYRQDEDAGYKDLTEEHKKLINFLQFDNHKFKLILMPRFSLKSCIVTIGFSLWSVILNPNIRILIYSDSQRKAQGFLSGIKDHILGSISNSVFRDNFPKMEMPQNSGEWNDSRISLRIRKIAHKEPNIDTGSIDTSKVGCHYDMIIFDDIVSDINVSNGYQMTKTFDCFKKSLSLLKPGGKILVVGTRWAHGDAYGKMLGEGYSFGVFIRKAEVEGTYPFEGIGLTKEFLLKQLEMQGSYFYSCLYQNEPIDDTTAFFKFSDFRFYKREHVDICDLYITCACDPAGEGEDFTAITVVGTNARMQMYLLYATHKHMKPSQIIEEIIKLSYTFRFKKLGIETNFFNGMLEKELSLSLETERENENFEPFGIEIFRPSSKRGDGKHARIISLQPYHERGDLLIEGENVESLRGSYKALVDQMLEYTASHRPAHDDLLDSLASHVKLTRRGNSSVNVKIPEGCIAKIVEEESHRMNMLQRRIPRNRRIHYEPVFA